MDSDGSTATIELSERPATPYPRSDSGVNPPVARQPEPDTPPAPSPAPTDDGYSPWSPASTGPDSWIELRHEVDQLRELVQELRGHLYHKDVAEVSRLLPFEPDG